MGLRTPDYKFEAYIPKHLEICCYKENFFISANTDIIIDGSKIQSISFLPGDVKHYQGLIAILNDRTLDRLSNEELKYVESAEYEHIGLILWHFFGANYSGNCLDNLHATSAGQSMYFCKNLKIDSEWKPISVYKLQFDECTNRLSITYFDYNADCMKTAVYDTPPFFIKCIKSGIKKQCLKDFNLNHPSFSILRTPYISHRI